MSQRLLSYAKGRYRADTNWRSAKADWKTLLDNLFRGFVTRADKDGPCWVPGEIIGPARRKTHMKHMSLIVFDLDGAHKFDDIVNVLKSRGLAGVVHTTYTHQKTSTQLSLTRYQHWCRAQKIPSDINQLAVERFLLHEGIDYLVDPVIELRPAQSDKGVVIKLTHAPVEKLRLIIPLDEDFDIMAEGSDVVQDGLNKWKRYYIGIGQALGVTFDRSCATAERTYYEPSHAPGKALAARIERFEGKFLKWRQFAPADESQLYDAAELREITPDDIGDRGEEIVDLFNVAGRGSSAALTELLQKSPQATNFIAAERVDGGFRIICPFDELHTVQGQPDAYFIPSPDIEEKSWPKIGCSHNSCVHFRTGHFLARMVHLGWFTEQQLVEALTGKTELGLVQMVLEESAESQQRGQDYAYQWSQLEPLKRTDFPADILAAATSASDVDVLMSEIRAAIEKAALIDNVLNILYLASWSQVTGKKILQLCTLLARKYDVPREVLSTLLFNKRRQTQPLEGKFATIKQTGVSDTIRNTRLQGLRQYYGFTQEEITAAYNTFYASTERQDEFMRKLLEFNERAFFMETTQNTIVYGMLVDQISPLGETVRRFDISASLETFRTKERERVTRVDADGAARNMNIVDAWLMHCPGIKRVRIRDRDANKPVDFYETPEGYLAINEFVPFSILPGREGDVSPFLDLLKNVWCAGREDLFNWVQLWFAHMLQFPYHKASTALVVFGGQGTGKSIMFEHVFQHILLGEAMTITAQPETITGTFNTSVTDALLFVAEESAFSFNPRCEGILKQTVSGKKMVRNQKFAPPINVDVYTRLVLLTNDHVPLKMAADDRRYVVLRTADNYKQNVEYFTAFKNWSEGGRTGRKASTGLSEPAHDGAAAVAYYLQHLKPESLGLSWEDLYRPPSNQSKLTIIAATVDEGVAAIRSFFGFGANVGKRLDDIDHRNFGWTWNTPFYWEGHDTNFAENLIMRNLSPSGLRSSRNALDIILPISKKTLVKREKDGRTQLMYRLPCRQEILNDLYKMGAVTDEEYHYYVEANNMLNAE